MTRITALM